MPNLAAPGLAATDSLILLIYAFFMLAAGFSLKPAMTTSRDFMQAGRAMPGWLCGLGDAGRKPRLAGSAGHGRGGSAVRPGQRGLVRAWLDSCDALRRPLSHARLLRLKIRDCRSRCKSNFNRPRSIPEYLGLRFDQKTRVLNAFLFAAMSAFSAGIALYAMARVFVALHVFDRIAGTLNLPPTGTLLLAMALPAALVLAYVLLGGLGAAMYNQAMQFLLVIAGLLPMVLLGLKKIGGWSGLKAVPATCFDGVAQWRTAHAATPSGRGRSSADAWRRPCAGRRNVVHGFQAIADANGGEKCGVGAKSPIIAAALRMFVPLVLVLPGLIAVGLPTPHTSIVIHNDNGVIYHEITVVPPAVEAGSGLVPAKADADGKPVIGAHGHAVLDYAMATPNVLPEFLPTGLLGLGSQPCWPA